MSDERVRGMLGVAGRVLSGVVATVALLSVALNSGYIAKRDYHGVVGDVSAAERPGPGAGTQRGGPMISGCPVLPADNIWNTTIEKLPRNAMSEKWVAKIGLMKPLHPDFGPGNGIPFQVIRANVKRVKVAFEYHDDSDLGNYPIPPDATIEGGPDSDGDRHVILVEQDRCLLFELWSAHPQPDGSWQAGSGVKMDLTDNMLREDGKTSADAAGLPILPGLVRYEEVEAGEIRHALRFTAPQTQKAYLWPARHAASRLTDTAFPPLGARFRLKKSFDMSGYPKQARVILKAMQTYGMFLADNGGAWFLSGVPDPRWDDDDLNKLKQLKGSDFEVVDEANLQLLSDSGRADPLETH